MKMWRWSNAAISRTLCDSSMPLPNTSPDMSPQPTTLTGSLCTSTPSSRKWRWTEIHAPRGGDPHRLVVVAVGPAAGEGVAEPETALERDRIGDVGEGRGALVGGDDEIGVLAVVDDDVGGMDHLVVDQIVGDRQQGADEDAVAFGALGEPRVAIAARRQMLGIEAALGAGRHDHRILDHLRLHQAEDFGAEIVAPVGPANAAAGDRPAAQMDALDARRIDPDLAPRHRRGKARDQRRIDLEGDRFARRRGEGVGPHDRVDQGAQPAQDAVVVDRADAGQRIVERLALLGDQRLAPGRRRGSWRAMNRPISAAVARGARRSASTTVTRPNALPVWRR